MSTDLIPESYVDRGELDAKVANHLLRDAHISLQGASKSGKSWLRQKLVPNAIVVQCRTGKTVDDIYMEALAALDLVMIVTKSSTSSLSGHVEASGEAGMSLLAKVRAKISGSASNSETIETKNLRQDFSNLEYIADLISLSNRRLVIEDVHYLDGDERRRLAFDLKTLWDYKIYVIIVGIWQQQSLIDLNSDLSGRVRDFSVTWTDSELGQILKDGSASLNLSFSPEMRTSIVEYSYGNAGLLQTLALETLDEMKIFEGPPTEKELDDVEAVDSAAMELAESLTTLYHTFAKRTSSGMRSRKNSTAIYAHALKVIMEQPDSKLRSGVKTKEIFDIAKRRESRIQLPNLRSILRNLDKLQTDAAGRGLILTFNESRDEVFVVDLQVLLYRRFTTLKWPWEEILLEASRDAGGFQGELEIP